MESVKSKIKKIIYLTLPKGFKRFIEQQVLNDHEYFKFLNISFSQEGEDHILSQYFYGIEKGFFIDIGAHQPISYSNTYKFYLKGWRGINIDAMPESMVDFNKIRSEDTNLEIGVSNSNTQLEYFIFKQRGVNTFSQLAAYQSINDGYELQKRISIKTERMTDILDNYLPKNQVIHFLSLDVEGFELEVLLSNNWESYRPKIILVESLKLKTKKMLIDFFDRIDYSIIAQTVNNLYFADNKSEFKIDE